MAYGDAFTPPHAAGEVKARGPVAKRVRQAQQAELDRAWAAEGGPVPAGSDEAPPLKAAGR